MYLGSSPFDAPGTYSLLQWTETVEGIWYPRGGFHKVVESLVNIAESNNAKFHFSRPVSHVRVNPSGTATGIVLTDGTQVDADLVVVNADLAWAHGNLFKGVGDEGMRDPRLAKRLEGKPHSYVPVRCSQNRADPAEPGVPRFPFIGPWTGSFRN